MSRVGKKPIAIPAKVEVSVQQNVVTVKGPMGALAPLEVKAPIQVKVEGSTVLLTRPDDATRSKSLHGLFRSLINNMIQGVTHGFQKQLEVNGVGYRAKVEGNKLSITVGLTHPLEYPIPAGFKVDIDKNNMITITGPDKHMVGQMAATIRQAAPMDPYKLKGIKYKDEHITKKAGKTVK